MLKVLGRSSLHCILLGLFLSIDASQVGFAANAFVRSAKGKPKCVHNGEVRTVRSGDILPDGATINTGPLDSVDLVFDGSQRALSITPGSEVKLELAASRIKIGEGEVIGSFRGGNKHFSEMRVQTPAGVTTVSRGDFSVNTADKEIRVLNGNATFTPPEKTQAAQPINAGQVLQLRSGPQIQPMTLEQNGTLMHELDRMASFNSKVAKLFRAASSYTPPAPASSSPEPEPGAGAGTPGYWMNHIGAWPTTGITIGGQTYTANQAIAIMDDATAKDMTTLMFQTLAAAKLNIWLGNSSACVADVISAADAWMQQHRVYSGVKASSSAWNVGEPLKNTLDNYNNGLLCAPSRG